MRQQLFGHILTLELSYSLATSQSVWLCEEVRHELVMLLQTVGIRCSVVLADANELTGSSPSLVQQLVKRVLSIGPRLPEYEGSCAAALQEGSSVHLYPFPIGFHVELL